MLILLMLLVIAVLVIQGLIGIMYRIIHRTKINNLLERVCTEEDLMYIRFEDFLSIAAEMFKRKGYKVQLTDKCGEDGNGLVLNDILYAEVWRHGLNRPVEVETAMKLARCMHTNSIYRGMLITLGYFKQNTKMFCHKNVIECVDGKQFLAMCRDVQRRKPALQSTAQQ